MKRLLALLAVDIVLVATASGLAATSRADPYGLCGPWLWYDPIHQVCAPHPPANPPPGYLQVCESYQFYDPPQSYWYDPVHGVCQPYPPAHPPPFYPSG